MERPWIMGQTWEELLFAHWPVSADVLREKIPRGLELDTFNGQAWVGVVPFRMSGIHPRGLKKMPFASAFPELNVRTYVIADGKPGVFFFSLDAANRLAVWGARTFFWLPYYNAVMSVRRVDQRIDYESHRSGGQGSFVGSYEPISEVFYSQEDTLDDWLTARYCLYTTDRQGRVYRGDISHEPWPLQRAKATIHQNTMAAASGIVLPDTEPLLHYSERVTVQIWPLKRV